MAEKITRERGTSLWMRYVEFSRIKDLLHIVYQNNGLLRPIQLENLGIEMKVLVKKDGSPLKHSARYHYRKVMEGLGLVKKNKVYYIGDDKRVMKFLKLTEFKKNISNEAKEILREIIVENFDCKKYFFDIFMEENIYTLKDLREKGTYAIAKTEKSSSREKKPKEGAIKSKSERKKSNTIILKNSFGKILKLSTQDSIQAIYWGVRLWALDLEIIDEILLDYTTGRIIYPISPYFSEKKLTELLLNKTKLEAKTTDSEWITLRIPDLIKDMTLSTRFSVKNIKLFLKNMKSKYPTLIMFIPSSTMFIDIKTPYEKQEKAIRNLYLYIKNVGFISHIRISKEILSKEVLP